LGKWRWEWKIFPTKVVEITLLPPYTFTAWTGATLSYLPVIAIEKPNAATIHPKNIGFFRAKYNFETAFETAWPLYHSQQCY